MYVRLCKTLQDKGKLIPTDENIYKYVDNKDIDHYVSVYEYNEEQKQRFEESQSVSGIKDVTTHKLIFDLDSTDLEASKNDTVELINRLSRKGINKQAIEVYYSGAKGFHLILNTEQKFNPSEAKAIAIGLAGDLDTFDSTVYNSNRILRLAGTKHNKTNLYKRRIATSVIEKSDIDRIKSFAKESFESSPGQSVRLPKSILDLKKQKKEVNRVQTKTFIDEGLNLDNRPPYLSPWKYALEEGFFPPGARNNAVIILASTYKAAGYDLTKAYYAIKAACEKQAARFEQPKFEKEEIFGEVERVFSPQWEGGTYSEDNFPMVLQKYLVEQLGVPRREDAEYNEAIVDVSRGMQGFESYAKTIDENTFNFGIKELDDILGVQLGHLIGILAPPGVGKTSMGITLLNNSSLEGTRSFFASYDMYSNIVFQKLISRHFNIDRDEMYDYYRNGNTEMQKDFLNSISDNYGNVTFCFKAGQTVDELKNAIKYAEKVNNEDIKLVVVDYLELIRTKSSDPTQASMEAIQGLREIANEGRVVVVLLQPNKMSTTPDEPILRYTAAKGSSSIAQAVTSMITCHRPGLSSETPENDEFFSVNIVKNRMGPLGRVDFTWDGLTGKIGEMDDIMKERLSSLRALKKMEKQNEEDF